MRALDCILGMVLDDEAEIVAMWLVGVEDDAVEEVIIGTSSSRACLRVLMISMFNSVFGTRRRW